eukprot:gb/GECH01011447.1/.p1 GENE.gb/GECH01011447.1/~~gb/GECH01011447.1/.p1  ORF type:complete len:251 (+),score=67.60 gb/GECH01011447.1/:1-753(+)
MTRTPIVGGNWKCNGSKATVKELMNGLTNAEIKAKDTEVVICPPHVYLHQVAESTPQGFAVGAQNCWHKSSGAFTGEVSAEMVKDIGASWTIIGHSERRDIIKEDDELIGEKVKHALETGLKVIVCIGEHLEEYKAGKTMEVLEAQMKAIAANVDDWSKVVIAYEPIFCIGTGIAMTPEDAQKVHQQLRAWIKDNVSAEVADGLRIQYGGSVKPVNCNDLAKQPDIDGFLVGGASLKAPDFTTIINSFAQ